VIKRFVLVTAHRPLPANLEPVTCDVGRLNQRFHVFTWPSESSDPFEVPPASTFCICGQLQGVNAR
jgi:hypothetical protein